MFDFYNWNKDHLNNIVEMIKKKLSENSQQREK